MGGTHSNDCSRKPNTNRKYTLWHKGYLGRPAPFFLCLVLFLSFGFDAMAVTPPLLSNPTVASITETSAILGATIVNDGGAAITSRGTVYLTSSPVTATDNPLAAGGTALGAFSHLRNNLMPQTQYFFAGYAVNATGTGLSPEGNFRTLSNSPTAAVTGFAAAPFSSTQVNLYWNMAGYPATGATATGYIIIRKTGSDPTTTGIVDGVAPASLSLPAGTTLVTAITLGTTISYSNTGLTNATEYHYLIVPFTWDGTNAATYNYYITTPAISIATTANNQTFACDGSALNTNKWSAASASNCVGTGQTNAFVSGSIANFCTTSGTGVFAAINISGITVTDNFTMNTGAGIITNQNSGTAIIDIAANKQLECYGNLFGNMTTARYIKNGDGTLVWAGGTFTGGFTLNSGSLIARGGNAMGLNASGTVTINGGTLAAASNGGSNFFGKFSTLVIGGDFQMGSTIPPALPQLGLSLTCSFFLGNANRVLTLGNTGVMSLNGVIYNTGSNGITFTANSSGLGRFEIVGNANTFSGPININGTGGAAAAEVRIAANGSLGNTTNTININGGRLSTMADTISTTINSTHLIQISNISNNAISVVHSSGTLTFNGVIADLAGFVPGTWAKQGLGTLSLGGISTYTGATSIHSGSLLLTTGNNRLPITTTVTIGQPNPNGALGALVLGGFNQEIAGLTSNTGSNGTTNDNTVTSLTAATLTLGGSGTYTYGDGSNANSGIITGAISIVKAGSGLQTFGDANTYTGTTTISNGELRLNPSVNTTLSGALTMNGGILGTTGIADTRTLTFSSFNLSDNSKFDLSSNNTHTITFTVAGTFAAAKQLVIYGWEGTSGMPGIKGKIFFGNSAAALTPAQLAQIKFNDGTIDAPGAFASSLILSNGEVVPDVFINATPTIVMNVVTTSNYLDGGAISSPPTPYAVSGVIGDPDDPFSTVGIDFTVNDAESAASNLIVTGTSNNEAVVPTSNVIISGSDATRNAIVTPIGVGYATITITVSDGVHTADYLIHYAASAASVNPGITKFLTGASDASTAQPIDNDYMFVGDDQDQELRLYHQHHSGLPIYGNDFSTSLNISMSNPQMDIEASVKVNNRIYWLASHSNDDVDGALRPNRYRLFATDIAGIGANATLSYVGRYDNLRSDLINWDVNNEHGLGANYFGLSASAAAGVLPEAADGSGFNIEGITLSPDNAIAYICFRAPISPVNNRTQALIVPLNNLSSLVNGNPAAGPAIFGAPILLDLGGRGIREIMRNASGQYIIIAGPHDGNDDIRLYAWTGSALDPADLRTADPGALLTEGKIESIINIPDPLLENSVVSLLVDNGSTVFYEDGIAANELPEDHHQKFRLEEVTLGCGTMVYNNSDSGEGSLRDAIACAPEGSVISFVNTLIGSTITLETGEILIDKNLTITGPGLATGLMVSGNNATRVFHIAPGKTLTLKNMSLVHCSSAAPNGGALFVEGNLTLQNIILDDNFEEGITPKAITINSPGGVIEIIGANVQVKQ